MRYTGQAASITSSTLKHKASSSRCDTPSTLVDPFASHDVKGGYVEKDSCLLNVSGRQSPRSGGLGRTTAVRYETPGRSSPISNNVSHVNEKVSPFSHSPAPPSSESKFSKPVRGSSPRPGAKLASTTSATNTSKPSVLVAATPSNKPLPVIQPSPRLPPPGPFFTDFITASPSSMASSLLPDYSEDGRPRRRVPRSASRTPSWGSRRQGRIGPEQLNPDSSGSDSDSDSNSIAKSENSSSTGKTSSTSSFRTSRYARLLEALAM